ncbi:MAG: glycine--tRNA ligase subunit beta [Alphaproteobacteria bacterium]|nr:glycine--tRNA ligase subunit beta [Alphaproteobacteria bacterium]
MPELLLELFSEEIPARMQARAAEDLKRLVTERLAAAGLTFGKADAYVTPRRLALVVEGLPHQTADVAEEKKGPRVGSPDQAIQGFLKSAGLSSLDQCEKRTVGKAEFWFAVTQKKGVESAAVLPGLLNDAITALPWPKSMRFADATFRWVRPLQSVMVVFDGKALPGALPRGRSLALLAFDDGTQGHRFLAPQPFKVRDFKEYRHRLRDAHVVLDREERKAIIERDLAELASEHGLKVKEDRGLLEEVAGLVEWPVVLVGRVDPRFTALPAEVLSTSMRQHQKYFTLTSAGGKVTHFGLVANMAAKDGGKAIVRGNERVLRARLSDAQFFWDQDLKIRLEDRLPVLKSVVFHAKLGSVHDKAERIAKLAGEIAKAIKGCDAAQASQAARLAKADLVSGMVGEFPELQGTMGRYYALNEKLPAAVADAIADHYAPQGPNDRCPTAPISVAVALADKIDSLVGFFAIDEKPTGSKDPYALRRAALGVIRLITENRLRLELARLIAAARKTLEDRITKDTIPVRDAKGVITYIPLPLESTIAADLMSFFADRLKVALKEKGVRHDLIAAVFALGGQDDIVDLLARVDALGKFLGTDDGANLLVAYRRAANILRIEEKKDGKAYDGAPDASLLAQDEEKALTAKLDAAAKEADTAIKAEAYPAAMTALAGLRAPVDTFFDKVTVNADDPKLRANRLLLLNRIRRTMDRVADFSRIEG